MNIAEAVGRTLGRLGVDHIFGVVGSGNFHVTNAMAAEGARFVAARHEGGAASMADGYARLSGRVGAVTVHQGCGLTNAMTGMTEAAKSRTPMVVVAAEAEQPRSNFYVDQSALATAVGAVPMRISADLAIEQTVEAVRVALHERRTVLLNLPLSVQSAACEMLEVRLPEAPAATPADDQSLGALADALHKAQRPVFIAGRGARSPEAKASLEDLAERAGALLATSAVARGLFNGNAWSLDVSGGFATPTAASLISDADLVVGWGCSLTMWTTRHGRLISPLAVVAQVDDDQAAIGANRPVSIGAVGDVAATARALLVEVPKAVTGYRTQRVRDALATAGRWRDVAFVDEGTSDQIDPRTLTIALDDLLPTERVVSIDSGNFMGYPSMFLSVPDERGFCFTQAFQSIGLGLASAIGAALAQPDRLPVAAVGDGGLMMAATELDTVRRLGLPMVVVVYDDESYGAEVHHFGPDGYPLDTVTFPPTDLAAVGRGYGFEALTVRSLGDLAGVATWVAGDRSSPLLVDAKVTREHDAWWLEEAFRGH